MTASTRLATESLTDEDVDRMIEPDEMGTRDRARLADHGIHVWALIAYLRAADGDIARVATDYHLPLVAVEAALQFYHRDPRFIDARLLLDSAENEF